MLKYYLSCFALVFHLTCKFLFSFGYKFHCLPFWYIPSIYCFSVQLVIFFNCWKNIYSGTLRCNKHHLLLSPLQSSKDIYLSLYRKVQNINTEKPRNRESVTGIHEFAIPCLTSGCGEVWNLNFFFCCCWFLNIRMSLSFFFFFFFRILLAGIF